MHQIRDCLKRFIKEKGLLFWLLVFLIFMILPSGVLYLGLSYIISLTPSFLLPTSFSDSLCTNDPDSGMPLTDKGLFILGLTVTLSTYVSTVSRGIITSIKGNMSPTRKRNKERIDSINQKKSSFWFLLVSDIVIWILLITPMLWNIFHWFYCLPDTRFPYFNIMRGWIFLGVYISICYMLFLHLIQAFDHVITVRRISKKIEAWKEPRSNQNLTQSEWFLEHLSSARLSMTNDQFAIYASLSRAKAERTDINNSKKWKVIKKIFDIHHETGVPLRSIYTLLKQLSDTGFIELPNNWVTPMGPLDIDADAEYFLTNLDGIYSI